MAQIIIFKNDDGSCGIIVPVDPSLSIEEIALKDVPEGKEYRIADSSQVPQDRYFRNAWTDDNETPSVDVDMDKARPIHMDNLRITRNKKLKALDVDNLIAVSTGDMEQAEVINSQKQELRDIPQTFDLSVYETPDELKTAIPEILL